MNELLDSIETNQGILFDHVRDKIVKTLTPERALVVYLPRGEMDLEIRSRYGVADELPLEAAGVSLTLIQNAIVSGKALSCLDAGDAELSDSLSAVLLGLSSVCVAPIIHPSGLRVGVLYVDDRRKVGRYREPNALWLGNLGLELGKKLSALPKMVHVEPPAGIKLPELPANKDFAQLVSGLGKSARKPKVKDLRKAVVQQLVDSIGQYRQAGGIPLASLQNELAEIRQQQGDSVEAERLLRECLETMRVAGQGRDPEIVPFMNNLAGVLYRNGDTCSAEAMYIQSLDVLDEKNPDHRNQAAPLLWNLGTLFLETGRAEKASAFLTRAAGLAQETWGSEDPRTKRCQEKLGQFQFSGVW